MLKGSMQTKNDGLDNYRSSKDVRFDKILSKAAEIFNDKGYQLTTMRDIAKAVNLTIGALYHYIHGKDELLFIISDRFMDYALKNLQATLEEIKRGHGCEIQLIIKTVLETTISQRDSVAVFLKEYRYLSPEKQAIVFNKRREYLRTCENIIRKKLLEQEFNQVDSGIVTLSLMGVILGICNWFAYWYEVEGISEKNLSIDYVSELFADIFYWGIYGSKKTKMNGQEKLDERVRLQKKTVELETILGELKIILNKSKKFYGY